MVIRFLKMPTHDIILMGTKIMASDHSELVLISLVFTRIKAAVFSIQIQLSNSIQLFYMEQIIVTLLTGFHSSNSSFVLH